MTIPDCATRNILAGRSIDAEGRFRLEIEYVIEGPEGFERSEGYIVDDKWPQPGRLGHQRIRLQLSVRRDQLHHAPFLGALYARLLEAAKDGQNPIFLDTQDNRA